MDINKMPCEHMKCKYLNGAYNDLANLLGIDAVLKIHSIYRGQQITFPVEPFSKEFGYSEKWIRKILKDHIDKQSK